MRPEGIRSPLEKEEITKLYSTTAEIPPSVRGDHLENKEAERTKIRLYDSSNPEEYLRFFVGGGAGELVGSAELVNYYDNEDNLIAERMKGGYPNYAISDVNEHPKRSNTYRNCMSIIGIAEDKKTGHQISFLTHQNPSFTLGEARAKFQTDLTETVGNLIKRAKPGTLDMTVLGGQYYDRISNETPDRRKKVVVAEQYQQAITETVELVRTVGDKFGVEISPVILSGPDYSQPLAGIAEADIVLDTQARIVFEARPMQSYALANEVVAAEDLPAYTRAFDQQKNDFFKPFPFTAALRQQRDTLELASRYRKGVTEFVPPDERRRYEVIQRAGVSTFESFDREDPANPDAVTVYYSEEHKDKTLVAGVFSENLIKKKIKQIINFESFLERALSDMQTLSASLLEIKSGYQTVSYFFNEDTEEIGYVIGGGNGFRNVEDAASIETALLQNVASFVKSFHSFLDWYVEPAVRKQYVQQLVEKIRNLLQKTSPQKYNAIMGQM